MVDVSLLEIVYLIFFAERSRRLSVLLTLSIHGSWALVGTVEVLMRSELAGNAL